MSSQLITSWAEHDAALQKALRLAAKTLRILDHDLSKFKLESRENALSLQRFLAARHDHQLCIVLKDTGPLRSKFPRLMELLGDYPQQMSVIECPPHLTSVSNSLCLADERNALVRIDQDHARARLIIDNAPNCAPYLQQFEAILNEGGEPIARRRSACRTPKMVHCSARTVIFCYNRKLISGHAGQPNDFCLVSDLWFVFAIFLSIGLLT